MEGYYKKTLNYMRTLALLVNFPTALDQTTSQGGDSKLVYWVVS